MRNAKQSSAISRGVVRRTRLQWQVSLAVGAAAAVFAGSALAQSSDDTASNQTFRDKFMNQVVDGTQIHGRVGVYDFRRWHDLNTPYPGNDPGAPYKNRSTAYGLDITLQTGMIYGFSAGLGVVYESNFYNPESGSWGVNSNLSPNGGVQTIPQGYLQYNATGFRLRAGRQLLNLPFAAADEFSFNPRAFQGVSAAVRPLEIMQGYGSASGGQGTLNDKPNGNLARLAPENMENNQYMPLSMDAPNSAMPEWQLFAAKMTRFKPRGPVEKFTRINNFYNDSNGHGVKTNGLWTVGTSYSNNTDHGNYIAQYYHLTFQNIENLEYVEGGYMAPTMDANSSFGGFAPYARAQYVHGYNASSSTVNQDIQADIFGLKLGVKSQYVDFAVMGNVSPQHGGTFNDGQLLHPYSDLSGVLYTDTMNDGIQNIGPGWALGARLDVHTPQGFGFFTRYVHYQAKHGHYHEFYGLNVAAANNNGANGVFNGVPEVNNQNSWGWDAGLSYDFGKMAPALEGLNVSDTLGLTHFSGAPNFYDNRVRVYYTF